ncbi:MAG TPA: enoyl-CoA hydratase [Caulobacteraceae bacterium]|nr:enoyl-CoA hydratase [Caulobacteraceae bacterium]
MTSASDILVHGRRDGPVARVILDDPGRANALSSAMIEALRGALARAAGDPETRVIVLAAEGRVFSAGHDLAELRASDDQAVHQALFDRCSALMLAIGACPKPVIARVQGAAVAAGCQLVASCDLAFAAVEARFAVSGIDLGLFCSTPSVALSRAVGRKAAAEMLFTGRFIGGEEAAALGLINRAVAAGDLDRVIDEAAAAIAAKAPEAMALGKALFRRQLELPAAEAYALAGEAMAENLSFPSAKAGIDGFLARRSAAR